MLPEARDTNQLDAILKYICKIENYLERFGDTADAFAKNEDFQDLCYYALVQIGEAVNTLSEGFKDAHPEIGWSEIYGMRCYLVHGYDNISARIIWAAIKDDLPVLRTFCERQLVREG